jgi:hypothetical protein
MHVVVAVTDSGTSSISVLLMMYDCEHPVDERSCRSCVIVDRLTVPDHVCAPVHLDALRRIPKSDQ